MAKLLLISDENSGFFPNMKKGASVVLFWTKLRNEATQFGCYDNGSWYYAICQTRWTKESFVLSTKPFKEEKLDIVHILIKNIWHWRRSEKPQKLLTLCYLTEGRWLDFGRKHCTSKVSSHSKAGDATVLQLAFRLLRISHFTKIEVSKDGADDGVKMKRDT